MLTGGPVPTCAALGVRQCRAFTKDRRGHWLDNQLGDSVTSAERYRRDRVEVDQVYQDLAAVASVDGAWRVDQSHPVSSGQSRPRMDKARIAVWQCNGDARACQHPLSWCQVHILGEGQVGAGITGVGIGGWSSVQHTQLNDWARVALGRVDRNGLATGIIGRAGLGREGGHSGEGTGRWAPKGLMRMDVHLITSEGIEQRRVDELEALLKRTDGVVWVDILHCHDQASTVLSEVFSFHPLAVQDCRERNRVPKVHAYEDHVFVVLHAPERGERGHVHYVELDQFIGRRCLVTVREPINPAVDPEAALRETRAVRSRIMAGRLRPDTPFELSQAIVSALTRRQEDYVEMVTGDVWQLENRSPADPSAIPRSSSMSCSVRATGFWPCGPWARSALRFTAGYGLQAPRLDLTVSAAVAAGWGSPVAVRRGRRAAVGRACG